MPTLPNPDTATANPAAARTRGKYSADFDALCIDGQHVAVAIGPDGASYAEQKANAAFIALACEAHDDLVAAVRELLLICHDKGVRAHRLANARAALTKVAE